MNEYWIVTDNKTGRVLAHCGDINDAIMMVSFDPHYRSYSRHRVLMDQVINVTSTTDKQLPGQLGLPAGKLNTLGPHKIRLPEGQQQPVKV
jgi:hypothetical protein